MVAQQEASLKDWIGQAGKFFLFEAKQSANNIVSTINVNNTYINVVTT